MKKGILIGIFLSVFILAIISIYAFVFKKGDAISLPRIDTETSKEVPVVFATWKDPVGFTFQYPKGLAVNKHDEDKDNYAHIELTDAAHPGSVIVWLKDVPKMNGKVITDLARWKESQTIFARSTAWETQLGSEPAAKILVSVPERKLYVVVLYDDLFYFIEANLGTDEYWQEVFDGVTGSFILHPIAGQSNGQVAPSADDNLSVDEEEVIE